MLYREMLPAPWLAPYVECFWVGRATAAPPFRPRELLVPDGTTELMLNFGGPYVRFAESDARTGDRVTGSHILGLRERGVWIEQLGRLDVFSIRFRTAGIAPFVRVPARALTQQSVPLSDVWGGLARELEARVAEARGLRAMVAAATAVLARRLASVPRDHAAQRALDAQWLVFRSGGALTVERLGHALGMSYKALERMFDERLGLTPKRALRVARFSRALHALQRSAEPSGELSRIAHGAGYADHAHFTREFRELAGLTPSEFVAQRFTIASVTEPALAKRVGDG
jgi:AraC-like DNA-binding protein